MFRLWAGLIAVFFCLRCLGQQPDFLSANPSTQELRDLLASGEPRRIAWAAYTTAKLKRADLIPELATLVASFNASGSELLLTREQAAMAAVADALIQLEATLPAEKVMHLYPAFPPQTMILMSRATGNSELLLQIFHKTPNRDVWLAASNLLAQHPTSDFVRLLLSGVVSTFVVRVVPESYMSGDEYGEGCAGDYGSTHNDSFLDWPKIRLYAFVTDHPTADVFAPGIHPVAPRYWETADYENYWLDGNCSRYVSLFWRTGLIAQLEGQSLEDFALKPQVKETVRFHSAEMYEAQMKAAVDSQTQAYNDAVEWFVQAGLLPVPDAADLKLKCRFEVQDERPSPTPLPLLDGKWCVAAAPRREFSAGIPE